MNNLKNKLLVSDFDGTLTDSRGNIPEANICAIRKLISSGGYFTISTGRTKEGFHNYDEELINAPVVLGNGALAYDYKNCCVAFSNTIGAECIDILNEIITDNSYLGTEIYTLNGDVYCINKNEANLRHFNALKLASFSDTDKFYKEMFPIVKIMVSAGDKSKYFQGYLDKLNLSEIKYIPTNGSFVEILSVNAGKGRALYQLARYLGIEDSNIFCAGDGSNDVDMLEEAPMSFCPSSGEKMAQEAADRVMCSSDDGVIADIVRLLEEG